MTRDGKSFVSLSPLAIIDKAIKEVPAVKYALGVAGVSAAVAIITFLIGKSTTSIFMLGAVFIGMILLFLFSTLQFAVGIVSDCGIFSHLGSAFVLHHVPDLYDNGHCEGVALQLGRTAKHKKRMSGERKYRL